MSAKATSRVVVVIPARYASTRLPGKPLVDIAGKPMIVRVAERTLQAESVERVLVATDDERIAKAVRAAGFEAVMTSPDHQSGTDRIAEAVRNENVADIIVNVQGDEPLLPSAMIDQAVQPLIADPSLPVGTLVRKITDAADLSNPSIPKVVLDEEGFALYFSRSPIPHVRDLPLASWLKHTIFYRHIGLYVFRREFLLRYTTWQQTPLERSEKLEQLRVLEHGCRMKAVVTELESTSVDTPEDLDFVRRLIGEDAQGTKQQAGQRDD